jgi:DNA-3-methyladenine glycosylase I
LKDERIIRNQAKIKSSINNAKVVEQLGLDLEELLWSFAPSKRKTPRSNFSWKATSKESDAMSKELKRLGFSFVGSTTMYALMQSSGMIFDHSPGCFRKD